MGDDVPWGALRWRVVLSSGQVAVDLSRQEFEQVCAAVEYDRVHSLADVAKAHGILGRTPRTFWNALVDGAQGLRFSDTDASLTLREVFEKLDAEATWMFPGSYGRAARDAQLC